MPRQPRLELPGVPMHVVQRGVNRCAIFLTMRIGITIACCYTWPAIALLCGCMRLC